MVTNSRMVTLFPIFTIVSSPANFRSCGTAEITAPGNIRQFLPILAPSMIVTFDPIQVPSSITTFLSIVTKGSITTFGATLACGFTYASGWFIILLFSLDLCHHFRFHHHFLAHIGVPFDGDKPPADRGGKLVVEDHGIAGHHFVAEL